MPEVVVVVVVVVDSDVVVVVMVVVVVAAVVVVEEVLIELRSLNAFGSTSSIESGFLRYSLIVSNASSTFSENKQKIIFYKCRLVVRVPKGHCFKCLFNFFCKQTIFYNPALIFKSAKM